MLLLYQKLGKHWKKIAKNLKSRSENAIKNRFNFIKLHYSERDRDGVIAPLNIPYLINALKLEEEMRRIQFRKDAEEIERLESQANR